MQAATILAVAHPQCSCRRPAIGEESVYRVTLIDLAVDGWHLLGKVTAEHAGREQPRRLQVGSRRSIGVALEPLGVRFQGVLVGEIAIHASDSANTALLHGGNHLAE